MPITKKDFKSAFNEAIEKHGLTVYFNRNDHYVLANGKDSIRIISIEFVCSTKIVPILHGSHNNNKLDGIGHFKFTIPNAEDQIDYFVFAFRNTIDQKIEFVIVPYAVLLNRFQNQNRIPIGSENAELTLWLMSDKTVYDTTDLSIEGEWYMLSGTRGRMADGTGMDYTEFLNNWNYLLK